MSIYHISITYQLTKYLDAHWRRETFQKYQPSILSNSQIDKLSQSLDSLIKNQRKIYIYLSYLCMVGGLLILF